MQQAFEFYRDESDRPKKPERLFFALFPDRPASERLIAFSESFVRERRLRGRLIPRDRLHVTLFHVGDYKRIRTMHLYAAKLAAAAVSARRFEVALDRVMSFDGPRSIRGERRGRPLVLLGEGEGLFEIRRSLAAAMRQDALASSQSFVPHLTIQYQRQAVPLQPIEPIHFIADQFALVHSEVGLTRYHFLGCWPLAR